MQLSVKLCSYSVCYVVFMLAMQRLMHHMDPELMRASPL